MYFVQYLPDSWAWTGTTTTGWCINPENWKHRFTYDLNKRCKQKIMYLQWHDWITSRRIIEMCIDQHWIPFLFYRDTCTVIRRWITGYWFTRTTCIPTSWNCKEYFFITILNNIYKWFYLNLPLSFEWYIKFVVRFFNRLIWLSANIGILWLERDDSW